MLDVACGTGIVARQAAYLVGTTGHIVGVDLNAGMLDVATENAPSDGPDMEWLEGDAAELPCADESFDVVLCQQGLQFFPNKVGAVREMHRVLAQNKLAQRHRRLEALIGRHLGGGHA